MRPACGLSVSTCAPEASASARVSFAAAFPPGFRYRLVKLAHFQGELPRMFGLLPQCFGLLGAR
jgi:hypothetical protein